MTEETQNLVRVLESAGFEQIRVVKSERDWIRIHARLPASDPVNKILKIIEYLDEHKIAWELIVHVADNSALIYLSSSAKSKLILLETLPGVFQAGVKEVEIYSQDEVIEIVLEV